MTKKRQIWQCLHAKVRPPEVVCESGHEIESMGKGGGIHIKRVYRGEPLILKACQDCGDYEEMGPPLEKSERGWRAKVNG